MPVALMLKRTMCRNILDIPSIFVCSAMHLISDYVYRNIFQCQVLQII